MAADYPVEPFWRAAAPAPPLTTMPPVFALPRDADEDDLPPEADADYALFVQRVRTLTGIDLAHYKPGQMRRRLRALAARHGAPTLAAFARTIERDPRALQAFQNFFTINVSEFFRDATRWDDLAGRVLPRLMQPAPHPLRVWSAGCSIGAEPYSLAILLAERYPGLPHAILATDIDQAILTRAEAGSGYTEADLRSVDAARRTRWFSRAPDGTYTVAPRIRAMVTFRRHDLLRDPIERGFDLIVCRNVVIYFTDTAKRDLYRRFREALRPGGVLFVGGTEVINGAREFGFVPWLTSFYLAAEQDPARRRR